jgi:hypothetical protein
MVVWSGCSQAPQSEQLLHELKSELAMNAAIQDAYIFFLTDLDCATCNAHTFRRINSVINDNPNVPMFGIFLTTSKKEVAEQTSFFYSINSAINWTVTKNVKLFGRVSQGSDKHHSPFMIIIRKKRIESIVSLSKG